MAGQLFHDSLADLRNYIHILNFYLLAAVRHSENMHSGCFGFGDFTKVKPHFEGKNATKLNTFKNDCQINM